MNVKCHLWELRFLKLCLKKKEQHHQLKLNPKNPNLMYLVQFVTNLNLIIYIFWVDIKNLAKRKWKLNSNLNDHWNKKKILTMKKMVILLLKYLLILNRKITRKKKTSKKNTNNIKFVKTTMMIKLLLLIQKVSMTNRTIVKTKIIPKSSAKPPRKLSKKNLVNLNKMN